MKSKKLFAILTLIAFMMTLVPALAFAERDPEPFYPGDSNVPDRNASATSFNIDTETVDANGEDTAKISVFVYDSRYDYAVGSPVYFASSRGSSDKFIAADGDKKINAVAGKIEEIEKIWVPKSEGDCVWSVLTDNTGKAEIKVSSRISGRATIGAALNHDSATKQTIYQYLVGNSDAKVDKIGFIGSDQVEFTAESASRIKIYEVKVRDRKEAKNVTVTETEGKYKGKEWNRANDLDYYEVSVRVTNNQGAPSADQQVTFSSNKTNCRLSDTRVYTDGSGIAKTKVYAKKAGTYEISFKAGSSKSGKVWLVFDPAEVSKIILKSDNNRMLAKDDTHSWKFELQDNNGNRLDVKKDMALDGLIESIDAIDYPTNAEFKTKDWDLIADEDNDWLKIESKKTFTKEGSYRYRITLNNGEYAEFKFEIREQGEYTGLKLEYDQTSLPMKAKSGVPTVTWVDANGVEKDANDEDFKGEGISFSASDYNKILDGKIDSGDGTFTATDDSDYIGDLIITAFDSSNKLSASFKITIGRELCGIEVEEPADNIEVGKVAYVPIKFVDIEGNQVAFGDATTVEIENAYALSKPAGAIVSVDEGPAFAKGLKEEGAATLEVESDKAGEAEIFVNVKTESGNKAEEDGVLERYYTTTFKVTFGEPKQIAEGAAQKVVMFIGSQGYTQDGEAKLTDVAPFIKDNRTFVAVRPVADAFGVTPENIGWNEATQTVTLVRDDMTVTIVIGSNDIEIVKDGVVSTVEADVPAFIADGRTVLPFRAVGDAFGVTTNWDEATQSVTYEQ